MTACGQNRSLSREPIIKHVHVLSAAVLACASFAAQAQSLDDAAPTHWRFGFQGGSVQAHSRTEPSLQVSLGYDIDRTWSVEALANVSALLIRMGDLRPGEHEFDSAVGARVLATLPVGDRWNLVGGLGVVQYQEDVGRDTLFGNDHDHKTSPMVSLAATYRISRRWSMGLELSSFTQEHSFNAGIRGEFHF